MAVYGRNRKDFEIDAVCKTIPDSPQGVPERDFLYGYTDREGVVHQGHMEENEMLSNQKEQRLHSQRVGVCLGNAAALMACMLFLLTGCDKMNAKSGAGGGTDIPAPGSLFVPAVE